MSDNNGVALPYDRVYVLGDSLSSLQIEEVKISITFDFWCYSRTEKRIKKIPNPKAYYRRRFCDGLNFFDHLKGLMPELPFSEENVFAYQGSGSEKNVINFHAAEKIDNELGSWKSWVESISINLHPGFDSQYKKVIDKENSIADKDQKGKPLVFIWGAGIHNDIISLPYLADYKTRWNNLEKITESDINKLSATLKNVSQNAGEKLKQNLTKLYDAGIHDIVFFDGLPIEKTPFFSTIKQNHADVPGFATFIDNMASSYNAVLHSSVNDLQKTFAAEGKSFNITYISSQDIALPSDLKSVSFLGEDALRNGKPFNLLYATNEEKNLMRSLYFYDPIHLSTKGALMVATFIKEQLLQKEANIKKYHQLCDPKKPIPNLDVRPKDQYIMVVAQNNHGTLVSGGR